MSEEDDVRLAQIQELLDALRVPDLSTEERARIEGELDSIGRVYEPFRAGLVYSELEACIDRLVHRQASIMPDFDAIRRRKDELDRRFFRPESP